MIFRYNKRINIGGALMSKYYLLLSLFLLLNLVGCSKSNKEEYNSSISTKITKFSRNQQWKEEGWYKAKDGDWFNNFLGWYRHVAYIESDNDMPQYFSFGTPMYPYFNLESYTKELGKKKKIKRILHLTILGLKKDINSVVMRFDNGSPEKFKTTRKHNIEIHFSNNDIQKIIDKLKKSKVFTIKVDGVNLLYNNKNFLKVLKE